MNVSVAVPVEVMVSDVALGVTRISGEYNIVSAMVSEAVVVVSVVPEALIERLTAEAGRVALATATGVDSLSVAAPMPLTSDTVAAPLLTVTTELELLPAAACQAAVVPLGSPRPVRVTAARLTVSLKVPPTLKLTTVFVVPPWVRLTLGADDRKVMVGFDALMFTLMAAVPT